MSRICSVCGKGKLSGHLVSHSNIKTNRFYEANLQKIAFEADGKKHKGYVCTRCMRTMRIAAPAQTYAQPVPVVETAVAPDTENRVVAEG
ncbi:MAG: 50S ribosomal protein L28 [Clostridiales bacterium]|jgi:large subunit ribosomal protein L28|nr:50S ribosomal protein L28 [Clostridiales bacterium]